MEYARSQWSQSAISNQVNGNLTEKSVVVNVHKQQKRMQPGEEKKSQFKKFHKED